MKNEQIIWSVIQAIIVGAGLVAYAHANFSTKEESETMQETLNRIDDRVYKLAQLNGVE